MRAVDYLKPISEESLRLSLTKIEKVNRAQRSAIASPPKEQFVRANSCRGLELIPVASVYYFLADQKYVSVFHEGEKP